MANRGAWAERRATEFLEGRDYHIVDQNYHCHRGEIDLIALDGDYVVFTEVRFRSSGSYSKPEESINSTKRRRIIHCAKRWIMENEYRGPSRFDVLALDREGIRHYENVFQLR
ncbi:MAG: YraN family protein [Candidatus Bipolaricaulota bacterium]